ncbi:DnaJ family domain-containing protein [Spirilliplanes yamanashiensis]|uniref:DUF1992 domain-containing protein n=1 Tax=Spirilliplanes yamanashiensis TaxID=42233 RepID=A0A8J3YAT1_9ACTN|nr:DUF1992 domain-containing protein [Spirilliplanes yamanashiensis]MDP9817533.1 hypothetical protein [Spirilliplanes yamanashiensis]GIJ04343.1 DUF1992 domain-containing protein [Spirilliplanes yamanashiensis]
MTNRWESAVDRQIREAQERGEWDGLSGLGKPLPGAGGEYDEDWWVRDWVRREEVTGVLPATLTLRRELEDLPATVDRLRTEAQVRAAVAALNERIARNRRGHLGGPPVLLRDLDADAVVAGWRERR